MSVMNHFWLLLAVAGLMVVTFVTRGFFLLTPERFAFPSFVQKALRYAPTIAIMAVIAPDIFIQHGRADFTWHNPALLAAIAAGLVFVWRHSLIYALLAGMALFVLLQIYA
jgi:branched-subunit amino acid transport protein